MTFFSELKRRNVFKVAVAYGIVAWLILQIASLFFPTFGAPDWAMRVFSFIIILGFPIAVILAWAFELTPEGVKPTQAVSVEKSITHLTGRRFDFTIIALLAVALGFVVIDNYVLEDDPDNMVQAPAIVPDEDAQPAPASAQQPERLSNSIAVLPLDNLSPNPDDAYFAAGIHEEILNRLAKISDMSVISRTSVLNPSFTDGSMSIPEIAEELNVEMIMEGSVRFANNQVRIAAQLIDAETDEHLWSEVYQRELADIFEVQAEIARHIADALEATMTPEELSKIVKPLTDSSEAYALYLKALSVIGDIAPFNPLEQSMEFHDFMDRTIELDPEFAAAHAFKAYDYAFSIVRPWPIEGAPEVDELAALARTHADAALALDPDIALAHASYGLLYFLSKDVVQSERAFDRSLELDPNGFDALSEYAFQKSMAGNHEAAIELGERGVSVNPHNWSSHALAGYRYKDAGDHATAVRYFREGVRLGPSVSVVRGWYAMGLLLTGEIEAGLAELELTEGMLNELVSPAWLAQIGYAYGLQGETAGAKRVFDRIAVLAKKYRVGDLSLAIAHLGVGQEQEALKYIERATSNPYVDEGFTLYTEVILNTYNDPVLEKPEFQEARRKLNFALGNL